MTFVVHRWLTLTIKDSKVGLTDMKSKSSLSAECRQYKMSLTRQYNVFWSCNINCPRSFTDWRHNAYICFIKPLLYLHDYFIENVTYNFQSQYKINRAVVSCKGKKFNLKVGQSS